MTEKSIEKTKKVNAEQDTITSEVMNKISTDEVKMKPHYYFIISSLLLSAGFIGLVITTVFIVNLIVFRLRIHDPFGYFSFGSQGVIPFLHLFPWSYLFLAIFGFWGGILFLKKYEFSYKHNYLVLALSLVLSIIILGFIIDETGFNEVVRESMPMRPFYQEQFSNDSWVMGEIVEIKNKEVLLITPLGEKIVVRWDSETFFPPNVFLQVGQQLRIIGDWEGDIFQAKGITPGRMNWRDGMKPRGNFSPGMPIPGKE